MANQEMESLVAKVQQLEEENKRLKDRLLFESTGRTKAERKLREQFVTETGGLGALRPVGRVASCFPTRFGTPRQGSLATLSRGTIQLDSSVVGYRSLEGLDEFSHVWILFVFHENTNMHKLITSEETPKHKKIFPSFVKPPQGGGIRVGLFATRTPHRPNPIGLSLVRLESVDLKKGIVHLRGLDLIDGTPVIDIKPYVPHVDTVEDARLASWVLNEKFDLATVHFTDEAKSVLERMAREGHSRWFASDQETELVKAVEQIVSLDPRGVIHGRGVFKSTSPKEDENDEVAAKETGEEGLKEHLFRDDFVLDFDSIRIRFSPHPSERGLLVHTVELRNE